MNRRHESMVSKLVVFSLSSCSLAANRCLEEIQQLSTPHTLADTNTFKKPWISLAVMFHSG